jgi:hypothetical protein
MIRNDFEGKRRDLIKVIFQNFLASTEENQEKPK